MARSLLFLCFIFIFNICNCTFLEELISQNMQFKCEYDTCTVGKHFCSLEDRACVPCDEDVCNEPDSPSMCKAYCMDYGKKHQVVSSPSPVPGTTTPTNEDGLQPTCPGKVILYFGYAGYGLAVVGIVISIILCVYMTKENGKKNKRTSIKEQKNQRLNTNDYTPPIQVVQDNHTTSKLVTSGTETNPKDIYEDHI